MPVSGADGEFTSQIGCRGRPSADRQQQRPLIEALTEPVTGFADAAIGGTSIRLNVTCGEGTAEFARYQPGFRDRPPRPTLGNPIRGSLALMSRPRPEALDGACRRRTQAYLWCPVTLAARPAPPGQQKRYFTLTVKSDLVVQEFELG